MNIEYKTDEIAHFYTQHRNTWVDFYESERWILERIAGKEGNLNRVLDVGCAAGGLGRALAERFLLTKYVGVDINEQAIQAAIAMEDTFTVACEFVHADIIAPTCLPGQQFELVSSFGCADWNIDTMKIVNASWEHVSPGGHFVISLRLTSESGVNDMARSYQYIHFGPGKPTELEEKANYVVFNWCEALTMLASLSPPPGHILGYGYWGNPSSTAVTPYDRLVFTVFAVRKTEPGPNGPQVELHVPIDLLVK